MQSVNSINANYCFYEKTKDEENCNNVEQNSYNSEGDEKSKFRSVYQSRSSANGNSETVVERGNLKALLWLC